jgi:hypothetical protein
MIAAGCGELMAKVAADLARGEFGPLGAMSLWRRTGVREKNR